MGYLFLFVFLVGIVIVFIFLFMPSNTKHPYEGLDTLIMEVRCQYGIEDFFKGQNLTSYQREARKNELPWNKRGEYERTHIHIKEEMVVFDVKRSTDIECIYKYKNEDIHFTVSFSNSRPMSEREIQNKDLLLKINKGDTIIVDGIFLAERSEYGNGIKYSIEATTIQIKE